MGSGTGIHKGRRKQLSAHIPAFCFLTSDTISSAVSSSGSFAFLVRWTAPLDQFFHSLSCFCKIILSQQQKRNKEEDDVGSIPGWENLNPRKTWCLECSREVGIPENYGLGLEDWEGSAKQVWRKSSWAGRDGRGWTEGFLSRHIAWHALYGTGKCPVGIFWTYEWTNEGVSPLFSYTYHFMFIR